MGHQEFERMILESEDLDRTDLERLEAHLQECDQCAQLSARLDAVEGVLGSASFVAAPEGFAARFQARLAKARQNRNARWMLLVTTLAAAAIVAGMGIAGYALYSSGATFLSLLLKGLNQVYWVGTVFEVALETAALFLESLLEQIPFLLWAAVSIAASSLVFTWITSFYRISYREIRRE
jgi:anti-sigma factor RsiW